MIPIYKPFLEGNYKKYVNDALDSTWISSKGAFLDLFEQVFSDRVLRGAHSTAVCNGSVALDLALRVIGVGPGDEVICPNFTYVATANAILRANATPVFVDIDHLDWNLCVNEVCKNVNEKTKAIIPVHIYGAPCKMSELQEVASRYGLWIVEDCAEAIGSQYLGQHVGTFGDISTFSFFGNKTVTTGEGGMVCCRDEKLIEAARHLKSQAVSADKEYWHDDVGFNFRMTNIQAAIGLSQLELLDKILKKKLDIFQAYQKNIKSEYIQFQGHVERSVHSRWMVALRFPNSALASEIRKTLLSKGVETRPAFPLLTEMPMYKGFKTSTPIASKVSETAICLPSYPSLEIQEVERISEIIINQIGIYYGR